MAKEHLEALDLDIDAKKKVKELSVSEIQEMEIAKALSCGSKVIIMDEPTSSLSDSEVDKLVKVIRTLKKKKVSIIYISHKPDELFEIADRVTVLRNGYLDSVRPQMVDIGSEQGLSNFETGGIAGYVEDFKRAKTPLWSKRCRLWMDNS